MNIKNYLKKDGEKPLDNMVSNGGFCGIFRKIVCIGDSLSSGEFEGEENGRKIYYDAFEYSWGQFIARDTGSSVLNFSRGGMTAKEYCESFAYEKGFWDRDKVAQAYIIALGVNDISMIINNELKFGEMSDIDELDWAKNEPTFVGYYASIIERYKEISPKSKFFLMTIPTDGDHKSGDIFKYTKMHTETLYSLADKYENCYVLDFGKYAPAYSNDEDDEYREAFYLSGHLSPAGYRLTALMVESYIDYIIRHNPHDFKQIGFIGTPFHNPNEKW